MDALTAHCFIICSILSIDFCARIVMKRSKDSLNFKAAGMLALLCLIFSRGKHVYLDKTLVLKRFLLSMLAILLLFVSVYLLLVRGAPKNETVLTFMFLLMPSLVLPFYHFLYELLDAHPLSVRELVTHFRLRGTLALILSANIVFLSLEPLRSVFSLVGHFALAFSAVLGIFYLCSRMRKKPSSYDSPFKEAADSLETATMRYIVSVLEVLYYLVLSYLVFIEGPVAEILRRPPGTFASLMALSIMLLFVSAFVKLRFYGKSPISFEFYEERALPLSFLLFGISSIVRFYF